MEDDHNGRQPQWKMTSMEDNLYGRQLLKRALNGRQPYNKNDPGRMPYRKLTLSCLASQVCFELGTNLNGRRPQWKTTSIEDDLKVRQPQWKKTSMEDDINGR